jgi:uncharacterized tellurite resistance protein B-like protein
MIDILKQFFSKAAGNVPGTSDSESDHDIRVATCALLVEIAQIDEAFTQDELHRILSILKAKFGLSEEHAEALISEAEKALEDSVDLWQFARLINENYSNAEKIEVIETLWRIVYVDGKMDQYEHYLMNKLQHLLRLSHEDLINAKLKVLHSR